MALKRFNEFNETDVNIPVKENVGSEEDIMKEFDTVFNGSIGALKAGGTPLETINELYNAYNEFSDKFKSILM